MCDNIHQKGFLLFRLLEIENSYYQSHCNCVAIDAINIAPETPGGAMSTKLNMGPERVAWPVVFIGFVYVTLRCY